MEESKLSKWLQGLLILWCISSAISLLRGIFSLVIIIGYGELSEVVAFITQLMCGGMLIYSCMSILNKKRMGVYMLYLSEIIIFVTNLILVEITQAIIIFIAPLLLFTLLLFFAKRDGKTAYEIIFKN